MNFYRNRDINEKIKSEDKIRTFLYSPKIQKFYALKQGRSQDLIEVFFRGKYSYFSSENLFFTFQKHEKEIGFCHKNPLQFRVI